MKILDCDFFVVGSGIAGLMSALHLAPHGRVLVATKKERADSNTNHAQGGIASVTSPIDSFDEHVRDTLEAGAGLCDEDVVREVIRAAPARIAELEALGVTFSARPLKFGAGYDLGKEGGHSRRRVLHSGDITGRSIERALLDRTMAEPNIEIREHLMVIDLITTGWLETGGDNRCAGAYVLQRDTSEIMAVRSPVTVLATGGGGKVYLYTSNPDIATGDGVALAWRAGVPIKNMEFIQFHPTCLYHPEAKSFLISEAVRGEGASLLNAEGARFMSRYSERGELAARDVVARAIDMEMKETGAECVYLDIRDKGEDFLKDRFPNIFATCLEYGIDMAGDLVPVVPAAHYFCGGVEAGIDGYTCLTGLYACGEVACTGLHGANRLASNSLLEAVVCADRMAARILEEPAEECGGLSVPDWREGDAVESDEAIVVEHNWNEVRTCMWDYVGIVRTDKRLERAWRRIRNLREEIRQYYLDYLVTGDILELRNLADVAALIVRSARMRKESRGLHYTLDHAEGAERASSDTIIADSPGSR
ncbi:MAG: L-aspartate oxidase [Lentisphaerae bacterium]|nr:L-aspartate oxidase [Lentisphaerota bacterium]